MSTNPTHRTRLARALAPAAGISYQKALALVTGAAEAGILPDRLDSAGMQRALELLLQRHTASSNDNSQGQTLEPRYYRLAELIHGCLQPGVPQRVARAGTAGPPPLRSWGDYDPAQQVGTVMAENNDHDVRSDWWQRVAAAGTRPNCILTDPYRPTRRPGEPLPIDRALDERDATDDIARYVRTLEGIVRREPRDVDAWAHLGNHYLAIADDPEGERPAGARPVGENQLRAWTRTALGYYQTAVGVAELALPDPFDGFLVWADFDNRPFFRGLHGSAFALWQLRRFEEAEQTLLNMLWLNPTDNQGARELLPLVRARVPRGDAKDWEDDQQ